MGAAPVYVGELLLLFGVGVGLGTGKVESLLRHPLGLLMFCFWLWQAACTLPYLGIYGLDAIRDAAAWNYSIFAWITAALILGLRGLLSEVLSRIVKFGGLYVLAGPAFALITQYYAGLLPKWPGTEVTIPSLKCGDLCVHLAGALGLSIVGLTRSKAWWFLPGLGGLMIGISLNRGGGLACVAALLILTFLYPKADRLIPIIITFLSVSLVLATFDIRFSPPGLAREISSQQVIRNVLSVAGTHGDESDLQNTKRWRMEWWTRIVDYTFHGPYFWTGKGYGINLTVSDGIDSPEHVGGLRSPHNSHLSFLARSGVPGFVLWAILQISWGFLMLTCHFRARSIRMERWAALFAWVFAYWIAFMINASFDVSFEGPVMGIPFWTVWGLGWGASLLFTQQLRLNSRRSFSFVSTPLPAY